jgi:heat shock protein HslJ
MRSHNPTHFAIAMALFAASSAAQAYGGVCFYEDPEYRGASQCFNAPTGVSNIPIKLIGKVSSVRFVNSKDLSYATVYANIFGLGRAQIIRVDAPDLSFLNFDNQVVSFKINASAAPSTPPVSLRGTNWTLIEVKGRPVVGEKGKLYLPDIQDAPASYTATAGCNTINGTYHQEAPELVQFNMGLSTMMACLGGNTMATENNLRQALAATAAYRIDGPYLTLMDSSKVSDRLRVLARFKAR